MYDIRNGVDPAKLPHVQSENQKRDDNYHNQRVNNTTYYTHRFENKEGLGMSRVDNLGPRGSKGKLFKLKRN